MTRQDTENNRRTVASVDRSSAAYNNNDNNMEYAWLEPRHDPIATDTNLAEIDFEDFKNEDLAFAFSCGVSFIVDNVVVVVVVKLNRVECIYHIGLHFLKSLTWLLQGITKYYYKVSSSKMYRNIENAYVNG